jgi:hypothetical protein
VNTSTLSLISKVTKLTLLIGATLYLIIYCILAFFRVQYPFELEWIEGAVLDHVIRIISGQTLYVSPSINFIPSIYNPLYFYLSAAIAKIVGIGFMPLRLISFISSLGCFYIIFLIVKQETKSNFSSLLASGLFAATFKISGAWFDIARVDSLYLFFLLSAIYLIKFKKSSRFYIFAGILISLACLTKQTALAISLPLIVYCIISDRRRSLLFISTILILLGVITLVINSTHKGWYSYYISLPKNYAIEKLMLIHFWTEDILYPLAIAFILSLLYIFIQIIKSNYENCLFYNLIALGMLGVSFLSRTQSGGYNNNLFPAYAVISILFGLAIHEVFELIQAGSVAKKEIMGIYIYLVCIIQFISLIYNPFLQIPRKQDLEAGKIFINTIAQFKGEVFVPYHGYLPTLAGKKSYAHHAAIADIIRTDNGLIKTKLVNEIKQAIKEERFDSIILDEARDTKRRPGWFPEVYEEVDKYYKIQKTIFDNKDVFWSVTGMETRPQFIYVPKERINSRS